MLNQVFDILSSIHYLKIILKVFFFFSGSLMALSFLFGHWRNNKHLLMIAIPCIIINGIIAYLFRLWDIREKKQKDSMRFND